MRLKKLIVTVPAGALATAMLIAASPAAAQTETTTAAQISVKAPNLAEGVNAPLGKGDEEFSQLFASWKALDSGNLSTSPAKLGVSIPSLMPVAALRISSTFGMRYHPIHHRYMGHKGVDLAAPSGTPVYAAADGVVGKAEWFGGYGNYIQIEHGGEIETRYGHLSAYAVAAGEHVTKGELIGYVGATGDATGPHLHYEVRIAGEAVNPMAYLPGEQSGTQLAVAEDQSAMGGDDD
jgi:murein DD-endopeptidase MepM/ murein hydrolase activator NlpD